MNLTTQRPVAFDPNLFGTRCHRAVRDAPERLMNQPFFREDTFGRTLGQDLNIVAGGVRSAADYTLNAFVGTGTGSDNAQIKRGVVGPFKDGMVEGTTIFLTHGLRAMATFWGIGASMTVGLANRWHGKTDEQTTEHYVYRAKNVTDGWASDLSTRSARVLTCGEEFCKTVTAIIHALATVTMFALALLPATVHACVVGARHVLQAENA